MFREKYPVAWSFHRNTALWPHQQVTHNPIGTLPPFKEYLTAHTIPLPAPTELRTALGAAIAARCSCRQFGDQPLPLPVLSTMLHASYGIQNRIIAGDLQLLTRPVPSGGGLYPLELYIMARRVRDVDPGIYHYAPLSHALEALPHELPAAERLTELFVGQSYAAEAALIIVFTARIARSLDKYADRGFRLIWMEAGHVAQNLNLVSAATRWGNVDLGGFFDYELAKVLGLHDELEVPLYATAIGKPRRSNGTEQASGAGGR